jgi:hypothetical protein
MKKPRQEILACLFAHEMLRRLNISSDDIFVELRVQGSYGVTVRAEDKEWVWLLGRLPISAPLFLEEWKQGVKLWNGSSLDELDKLGYENSPQVAMSVKVIQSLQAKGIPIDPLEDMRKSAN